MIFDLGQNYITRGFWGDEAWTSLISQLPYSQMFKTTASDFHPPAYYTIVEIVYKFLPPTEIVTRAISIIFYLLTVFLVYKLASLISTSKVSKKRRFWGLLSAIIVSVNPIFFTYAFEARNYTMFAFAATGSMYFLIKLSEKFSLKSATLLVILTTLGIYTHYFMFFILAAQGIYVLIFARQILVKMIGIWAIVGVLYLPWIPFFWGQLSSVSGNYWIGPIDNKTHWEALTRILSGEYENIFRPMLFSLSLALVIIGLVKLLLRVEIERPYNLVWLWALTPFVLATLPGLTIDGLKLPFRPIFFWRYLIPAAIPFSLIIVRVGQKLPKYLFEIVMAGILVLSLAIDSTVLALQPATFRQVYEEKILSQITRKDRLVTVLPSFAEVLYYRNRFGLKNEIIVLPEGLVQFSGKSLLDAYVANGVVKIGERPSNRYFELRPGPSIRIVK